MATGAVHDSETFLAGASTPVLFTSAVLNFGIDQLLSVLLEHAPSPSARPDSAGADRPLEAAFSGQVFKIQAGMDRAHRDRVAFVRICSGQFERGMSVTNARTRRAQALYPLRGESCGNCDTAIPMQRRNHMAVNGPIDVCEACGVLLYRAAGA